MIDLQTYKGGHRTDMKGHCSNNHQILKPKLKWLENETSVPYGTFFMIASRSHAKSKMVHKSRKEFLKNV